MPNNTPKNADKAWTTEEIVKFKLLINAKVSTQEIAQRLGRTMTAIYDKASELGLSLKPVD